MNTPDSLMPARTRLQKHLRWAGFVAISLTLGVCWHLLIGILAFHPSERIPLAYWPAGAFAGLVAGVYTARTSVPDSLGYFITRGIITYYVGIVSYWLGLMSVMFLQAATHSDFTIGLNLGNTLKSLALLLVIGTFPFSMLCLPLTFVSRICLSGYLVGFRQSLGDRRTIGK